MALFPNTLALQRDRVRLLIQEPTAQHWTNATLNLYINEAQACIATGVLPGVTQANQGPILASESTTPSVDDQQFYSMPDNMHAIRVIRARSVSTEDYVELTPTDIAFVRAHPRTKVARPDSYFLWGESGTYQLGVYPAFNSANGLLYVSFWRLPTNMASDSTVLQIPVELLLANTYLAAYRAKLERGHLGDADMLFKTFLSEYQGALAYINQRQINKEHARMMGTIGDDDSEMVLY